MIAGRMNRKIKVYETTQIPDGMGGWYNQSKFIKSLWAYVGPVKEPKPSQITQNKEHYRNVVKVATREHFLVNDRLLFEIDNRFYRPVNSALDAVATGTGYNIFTCQEVIDETGLNTA